MQRRSLVAACLGAPLGASLGLGFVGAAMRASAQSVAPAEGAASRLWFDPTQLQSFTSVVDRYLINPAGRVDRLLFRDGPQVILADRMTAELQRAVPAGAGIVVWGVRARRAPVITMLAWATREADAVARFVERPVWGFASYEAGSQAVEVAGEVVAPLYTPQGETMGAILQDGMVIRVTPAVATLLGDRLAAGRKIAAAGPGTIGPLGRALDAERIGESLGSLGLVPRAPERTQ